MRTAIEHTAAAPGSADTLGVTANSERHSTNLLSGNVIGPVVRAGSVGHVHFHGVGAGTESAVPRRLAPAPANFTNRDDELDQLDRPWAVADRCGLVVLGYFMRALGAAPDELPSGASRRGNWCGLCGGLPIALSVTATRLAGRRLLGLRETVVEPQEEQRRLGALSRGEEVPVRSVFDVSYQELPAPAQETYRILGLHPGPEFHLTVVAAATGRTIVELREPLDALLDANLLQEVHVDRFRFHDLIRSHAKEKADAEDTAEHRTEVALRIVEHYIRRTGAAAELCTPHLRGADYDFVHPATESATFADHREALDWLEHERVNLVGAVRDAVRHGRPAAAWQLGHVLWPLFRYRGHHADWRTVDELCLTAARQLDAPENEARTARRLAMLHHRRGAWAEAARLLDRCGELFAVLGDAYGTADTHDAQAVLALAQDDPTAARRLALRAEADFHELEFPRKAALALLLAGQAEIHVGAVSDGLDHVRTAEARLRESRDVDPFNATRARIALGAGLVASGELAEASVALADGLAAMTELGSLTGRALAHHGLADLAAARHDPATERDHLTEAVRLFDHQGDVAAEPLRDRLTDPTGPA